MDYEFQSNLLLIIKAYEDNRRKYSANQNLALIFRGFSDKLTFQNQNSLLLSIERNNSKNTKDKYTLYQIEKHVLILLKFCI